MEELQAQSNEETLAFRSEFRQNIIPKTYNGLLHVCFNGSILVGTCLAALSFLSDVKPTELLTIPAVFVLGNLVVWLIHKYLLHQPLLAKPLYVIHSKHHHRFFTHDMITFDSTRDFFTLFFPWWTPLFFLVSFVPGAVLLGHYALGSNVAALTIFMGALYFILYEVFHFMSHLPKEHWLLKVPYFFYMREHHRLHHNLLLMSKYNFNVVAPLFDWLLGTLYKKNEQR